MAALSQAYEAFERPGLVVAYRMSNVKIYKGALVGINANGHVVAMAHGTANLKFIGVANETVDNAAGSAGGVLITITKTGSFLYQPVSGVTLAITDLGKEVFAQSDWEVQLSTSGLTNAYKVGTLVALETTSKGTAGGRIRIDNHTV